MNNLKGFLPLLTLGCLFSALAGCGNSNKDLSAPNLTLNSLFAQNMNSTGTSSFLVQGGDLNLSGTVEAGAETKIEINSEGAKTVTVVGETWSYLVPNDDLEEGANTIMVSAKDDAENQTTITFSVTKDTTGPEVTLDQFITPEPTGTQTIAGTVETGSLVTVSINDGPEESALVSGGGWTYALNGLAPGTYSIVALGMDALGNLSETPANADVEVDPGASVLTIDPVSATTDDTVFLAGTRSTAANLIFTPIDTGGDISDVDLSVPETWTATFSDLDSGFNLLSITIGADPVEVEARVLVQRDRTGPRVLGNQPADGATVAVDSPISVTFDEAIDETVLLDPEVEAILMTDSSSAEIGGSITYNSATWTATFLPDVTLAAGETFTVTAKSAIEDILGNKMGFNYKWTFFTANP